MYHFSLILPAKSRSHSRKKAKGKKSDLDDIATTKDYFPFVPPWPRLSTRYTQRLSLRIIDKMETADTDKLFRVPVSEQYPLVAERYLDCIKLPMDFKTIREDRLQGYTQISELQEDLILILRNCCRFNGEKTKYWYYAVKIWKSLTDVFNEACDEEHIDTPRRW